MQYTSKLWSYPATAIRVTSSSSVASRSTSNSRNPELAPALMPAPGPAPAPARPTRDGLRVARLFRQVRVPGHLRDVRRCDLDAILEEDELDVCESEVADCGYAACLIRVPEGGGGVMIAAGQEPGRRRFSLAHELGHFHIPSHKQVGTLLPEVGQGAALRGRRHARAAPARGGLSGGRTTSRPSS